MSEEFYIGLNLFSVFLASCTQVVLKKSAMNDRLTGLAYFVNRPRWRHIPFFGLLPADVLLPVPPADDYGEHAGMLRICVYPFV